MQGRTDSRLGAVAGFHRPLAGVAGRSCLYRNLFVVCAHVAPASASPRQPGLLNWMGRIYEEVKMEKRILMLATVAPPRRCLNWCAAKNYMRPLRCGLVFSRAFTNSTRFAS